MADNVTLPATGAVIAADDVGGVQYQIVKVAYGADGVATVMDVQPATEATLAAILAVFKAEDSPAANGDFGIPLLGMRNDADTTTVSADGDYSVLKLDENGRLKVSTQPASYLDGTGNITASGQTISLNVDRASNVTISMVATSLVGHNATFEYSNNSTNGTDGNWYGIQVVRSNANTVETSTGTLAATPAYGWEASVNAYKWVRVRATAHTSGTAAYILKQGTYATEPIPAIQVTAAQPVSGTVNILGQAAHSVAASGNPVRGAAKVQTAVDTTLVANDTADLMATTSGALIVKPYSPPDLDWQFTSSLTTTTAVAAKAAGAAGVRNYVTDISFQNTSATATTVLLLDGSTVIAQWNAPANMANPTTVTFATPRRGTAATAMNANCGTTGANVLINVGGYQAP